MPGACARQKSRRIKSVRVIVRCAWAFRRRAYTVVNGEMRIEERGVRGQGQASCIVNDHVALRQVAGVDWTFISVHVHVVREYFL